LEMTSISKITTIIMQLIVVTGKTYRPSKIKSYFDITD